MAQANQIDIIVVRTTEQLAEAIAVRQEVFVGEQGVSEEIEIDSHDEVTLRPPTALHVLARADGEAAATGRLLIDGAADQPARIGRVAVRRAWRHRGLGYQIMHALHEHAKRLGYKEITIAAQISALPFYERLGYVARGETFLEADIEHRWMDRTL